jgi:hypothetical protein
MKQFIIFLEMKKSYITIIFGVLIIETHISTLKVIKMSIELFDFLLFKSFEVIINYEFS